MNHALEVDGNHPVPHIRRGLYEGQELVPTRAVYQHVYLAEQPQRFIAKPKNIFETRNVRPYRYNSAACCFADVQRRGRCIVESKVSDRNVSAGLGKCADYRPADPARAPSDDHRLSAKGR